jgi:hypothetical protein
MELTELSLTPLANSELNKSLGISKNSHCFRSGTGPGYGKRKLAERFTKRKPKATATIRKCAIVRPR